MWSVEITDEFESWWNEQADIVHEDVTAIVDLLEECGPALGRPHSGEIKGSRHKNMRELRVQSCGEPYRVPLTQGGPRSCCSPDAKLAMTDGMWKIYPRRINCLMNS